jgi:hypothetical protein
VREEQIRAEKDADRTLGSFVSELQGRVAESVDRTRVLEVLEAAADMARHMRVEISRLVATNGSLNSQVLSLGERVRVLEGQRGEDALARFETLSLDH